MAVKLQQDIDQKQGYNPGLAGAEQKEESRDGGAPEVLRMKRCDFNHRKACDESCIHIKTCTRARHDPTPCEWCSSRRLHCHETCEAYKTWKAKRDERLAVERKARNKA